MMRGLVRLAAVLLLGFLVSACGTAVTAVTPDLYSDAVSARATSDAALQQAQFQERFLTASAQAPIVHITETAAAQAIAQTQAADALAMQQQMWTATAQQAATDTAVPLTRTAQSWTPTPNATQTAAFAVLNVQSTQMANEAIRDNLQREREEIGNQFRAVIPGVLLVAFILGSVLLLNTWVRRQRYQSARVDERGNVLPVLDIVDGTVTDIDRNPNYRGSVSDRLLVRVLAWWIAKQLGMPPQLPEITAKRQDEATRRDQLLDLVTRGLPEGGRRAAKKLAEQEMARQLSESTGEGDPLLPVLNLPDSHLLNQWDGKFLPYGVDENQKLLTVDPTKRPHLMVTGTTGTGKTRYEIRTIVAGALASGWQVIVIGKQADYIPFQDHTNVTLIPANAIKESDKYIRLLKAASEEMFRRDAMLTSKGISTWDRYGAPQTMIVVDDYTAAMFMMRGKSARDEVLAWALALAMDGRKYGLNLLLGLQRATWTCISTDLRSQMARITLRVGSTHESRIVLDAAGAEALPDRHFLARLEEGSGLIRGAAFAMTDMETYNFLASRPVKEVGEAGWVDAVATEVLPEPERNIDQEIRDQLTRMRERDNVNLSQVQRTVFGDINTGGANFRRVQNIWIEMQAERATTTRKVPDSEPLPGSAV